jgi:hypothetical protein
MLTGGEVLQARAVILTQKTRLQVKKLEEEMKFYKLELINREDNFNNKFGGNGGPMANVVCDLCVFFFRGGGHISTLHAGVC